MALFLLFVYFAYVICNYFGYWTSYVLQVTWQWLPFTNSARKDDLNLYHWVSHSTRWIITCDYFWACKLLLFNVYVSLLVQVRIVNGVLPTGDYSFAKYNKVAKFMLLLFVFVLPLQCLPFWFCCRIWFSKSSICCCAVCWYYQVHRRGVWKVFDRSCG